MKKSVVILLTAIVVASILCGCSSLLSGNGYSATPHVDKMDSNLHRDTVIYSYDELVAEMENLVSLGSTKGVIFYSELEQDTARQYVEKAICCLTAEYPVGAYAVDTITYEIGDNSGKPAIALEISYHHNRSEILHIRKAQRMEHAKEAIASALKSCENGVVIEVQQYEQMDLEQYVQDYVIQNPDICMEMPQVTVALYPDSGEHRVIDVRLAYQNSRDVLRGMQETVKPVFDEAAYTAGTGTQPWDGYARIYTYLMERYSYKLETSITPAYSLLHHGVGDSKAFASVYACMCRKAGLACEVVTGTKGGEPWYWNVIQSGNEYFYADLLSNNGKFSALRSENMTGYVWDYSAYRKAPDGRVSDGE